jgi:hypothetical protein
MNCGDGIYRVDCICSDQVLAEVKGLKTIGQLEEARALEINPSHAPETRD